MAAVESALGNRGLNVLGGALQTCSLKPRTGFFRDGCCRTCEEDLGAHTVCCVVTAEFLVFSQQTGNDLSTAHPEFGFPGLKPGDGWCVCADRWQQAFSAGSAPGVILEATHARTLDYVGIDDLMAHAVGRCDH